MLLSHAITLAEARSHIAALADRASSFDASVEYERVLLGLDQLHDGDVPGIAPVPTTDPDILYAAARSAVAELAGHGVDDLQVELLLDMLAVARQLDVG